MIVVLDKERPTEHVFGRSIQANYPNPRIVYEPLPKDPATFPGPRPSTAAQGCHCPRGHCRQSTERLQGVAEPLAEPWQAPRTSALMVNP